MLSSIWNTSWLSNTAIGSWWHWQNKTAHALCWTDRWLYLVGINFFVCPSCCKMLTVVERVLLKCCVVKQDNKTSFSGLIFQNTKDYCNQTVVWMCVLMWWDDIEILGCWFKQIHYDVQVTHSWSPYCFYMPHQQYSLSLWWGANDSSYKNKMGCQVLWCVSAVRCCVSGWVVADVWCGGSLCFLLQDQDHALH